MFCVQESESTATLSDTFSNDKDPLDSASQQSESDDEPTAKRSKMAYNSEINLQVYKIPAFNIPKSLSIFPSDPSSTLPKFVNNPLNLANPLSITTSYGKPDYSALKRYSLPAKLPLQLTPQKSGPKSPHKVVFDSGGGIVRYKKNGEVAKKRGPPKGYKRKPKADKMQMTIQNITDGVLAQAHNLLMNGLLGTTNGQENSTPNMPKAIPIQRHLSTQLHIPSQMQIPSQLMIVPQIKVPPGVEVVQLECDPADWFPEEPYKMTFSRKKNPKWKNFPYRCEHCFKGYRVVSTLLQHASERHGCVPRDMSIPCPCCPHVSSRKKHHKKHLETHHGKRHRIFCLYCVPIPDPTQPYEKEATKYPFEKYPQFWYASEESLRLHKKRKHPYSAMFNSNWYCSWGDSMPNS